MSSLTYPSVKSYPKDSVQNSKLLYKGNRNQTESLILRLKILK